MAGGFAHDFQPQEIQQYKALLPINGQPIVKYVIRALEQSNVEKIFIVQEKGTKIQEIQTFDSKCVFFNKEPNINTYSLSFLFGLEMVAQYYGYPQINQKSIMIVPCDIPLVTKENFNSLIEKASSNNGDITITIIAEKLLRNRFPQKHFRSVYLTDFKGRYTIQMVGFMNGDLIQFESARNLKNKMSFRGVNAVRLEILKETFDTLRKHRHHDYQLPRFTDKFAIRWLFKKEFVAYILKFLFYLMINRLTITKITEYLSGACQVNITHIESKELEISADIDRPEDFPIFLGIPCDN